MSQIPCNLAENAQTVTLPCGTKLKSGICEASHGYSITYQADEVLVLRFACSDHFNAVMEIAHCEATSEEISWARL